ncbi:MAG: serine protease [Ahrensia sp.]
MSDGDFISNVVGTGFFIAPQFVLTAAHCVFDDRRLGGKAQRVKIEAPTVESDSANIVISSNELIHTPFLWNGANNEVQHDYAIIDLRGTRFFAKTFFVLAPTGNFSGHFANIAGYPADRDHSQFMYHDAGIISDTFMGTLRYKTDTGAGQSGGPVWCYDHAQDKIGKIVGIHIQKGDHFEKSGEGHIFIDNIGVAISQELRDFIAQVGQT